MEKLTIYKNKGEIFRCNFKIDGASTKDTSVRLCLEFDNNINLFFYGSLDEDGSCVIEIPKLKNMDDRHGRLAVEAIADSIYFKVYEAEVELKNNVEVTMQNVKKAKPVTNVELEGIMQEPKKSVKQAEVIQEKEEPKEESSKDGWEKVKWTPPKYESNGSSTKTEEKTPINSSKFRSFQEYFKKQKRK